MSTNLSPLRLAYVLLAALTVGCGPCDPFTRQVGLPSTGEWHWEQDIVPAHWTTHTRRDGTVVYHWIKEKPKYYLVCDTKVENVLK